MTGRGPLSRGGGPGPLSDFERNVLLVVERMGNNWEAVAFDLDSHPDTCRRAFEAATERAGAGHDDDDRLAVLVDTIREQADRIEAAAKVLVEHAIALGEALLEAQQLVPAGDWNRWVRINVPFGRNRTMCRNYMRLAALKEHVDSELTIAANLKQITGLQRKCASVPRKPAEVKAEAIRLYTTGQFSYSQVAAMVGTTSKSVHSWVDPEYAEQVRRNVQRNEANRRERLRALPGGEQGDRAHRYGEPGRAALNRAFRKLSKAATSPYMIEALLDIEAIASAWRERLDHPEAGAA
jgi:hypothetical protein